MTTIQVDEQTRSGIDRWDQYFSFPWAIEPSRFDALYSSVKSVDLHAHVHSTKARGRLKPSGSGGTLSRLKNGTVVIGLAGTLLKAPSSILDSTSTVWARRQLRLAANNNDVRAILLHIDSPGGIVAGVEDLAQDVAAAAKRKPLHAFIADMGASAAYWVASQASKVFANDNALVGSIGVFTVLTDRSEQFDRAGVKVHVIRAGQFKGVGTPGTEITDEHLAHRQQLINDLNGFFVAAVSRGRKLTGQKLNDIVDGRVHVGHEAAQLGLVDGIKSLDEVLAELGRTAA